MNTNVPKHTITEYANKLKISTGIRHAYTYMYTHTKIHTCITYMSTYTEMPYIPIRCVTRGDIHGFSSIPCSCAKDWSLLSISNAQTLVFPSINVSKLIISKLLQKLGYLTAAHQATV